MNKFGQKNAVPLAQRLALTPEEVSALTGIGLTATRQAINTGALSAKKHGRRLLVMRDAIGVWLEHLPDAKSADGSEAEPS